MDKDIWDWECVALGIDAAFSLLFYTVWKKAARSADLAEQAEQVYVGYELDSRLAAAPNKTLPYVCIEGVTEAIGSPLASMFKPEREKGVIQTTTLLEYRSRRQQGHWTDISRYLRCDTNTIPFQLIPLRCQNKGLLRGRPVEVSAPLSAVYLMEGLKVTYDRYSPSPSSAAEKGIDRIFGDVTKGLREKEKMLGVGVHLLGIGRVVQGANGRIRIMPPLDVDQRYILTSMTKEAAVRQLDAEACFPKIMFYICAVVGAGILAYWGRRLFRKWERDRNMRRAMEEFRRQRATDATDEGTAGDEGDRDENCVICLTNHRSVVLLHCGHICVCAQCAHELPKPQLCPICREPVIRFQPIYMS